MGFVVVVAAGVVLFFCVVCDGGKSRGGVSGVSRSPGGKVCSLVCVYIGTSPGSLRAC